MSLNILRLFNAAIHTLSVYTSIRTLSSYITVHDLLITTVHVLAIYAAVHTTVQTSCTYWSAQVHVVI